MVSFLRPPLPLKPVLAEPVAHRRRDYETTHHMLSRVQMFQIAIHGAVPVGSKGKQKGVRSHSLKRIIVHSPKTERYKDQESRVIPLFPELVAPLREVFELAKPGTVPVITRYRQATQNLGTTFVKIIKRAGLVPWPKPFQNLRSTRETELMEIFPSHVVVSWIGHSEAVARRHYLQTTDAHFEKAVSSGGEGHRQGHKACEMTENGMPTKAKNPENHLDFRGSSCEFAVTSYPAGT